MPQNISEDRVNPEGIARITADDAQRLARYLVKPGDIVYSRRGDVERRALITERENGWLCGTGCLRVRFGDGLVDPVYASYFLSHPASREWVVRHAVGATMPNLNTSILGALPFLLLPIKDQLAIAGVLGALDDKIEQNRRTAHALERLARAMFRAWFVDFEPVKAKAEGATSFPSMPQPVFDSLPTRFVDSEIGPVPEGWEVTMLGDCCGINEQSIRKDEITGEIEYVDIAAVSVGRLDAVQRLSYEEAPSRARRRARHGDTIWSCVRPNRRSYLFIHSPAINTIVSTGFAVLSPSLFGPSYLHQLVTQPEFVDYLVANADGSAYPAVRPEHFASAPVLRPPIEVLQQFELPTMPGRDLIASAERESQKLAEMRDYLLPRLLSGDVRVSFQATGDWPS